MPATALAARAVDPATAVRTPRSSLAARLPLVCGVLLVILLLVVTVAAGTGPVSIAPARALAIVAEALGWGQSQASAAEVAVLLHVRLPRVVVGAIVGAALAVAGVAMQGVFRNPLAEPGVIGVSAGASLGAVIALYFGLTSISTWLLPGFAFAGAVVAVLGVFLASQVARRQVASTMLLVGIAVNALLGAVISIMLATASTEEDLRSIVFWLQGGLDARTWQHAKLVVAPVLVGCALLTAFARDLNVMVLGEDQGRASGVNVARSRAGIMVVAALITGVAVSVTGTISFVGMVVPHALRLALGPDHRLLMPAAAIGGATFLVLADLVARTAFGPAPIQVGVITSIIGAPVLLLFVLCNRRRVL
ncbi:FecCD family ABC transporter permease [Parenemella sanctibonifatiensis]|uniref:ABC transporter permease n=1 Tax=Parenemella sanctibonifatiensis TaxID=2016505 RepID=A0A255E7D7_9ACTN|nr:iron ABC transporter permease [Parenemella sanctibonifatiensis]OYN85312.1 ABC transporter permease [Parenemella sanctibonifatiensis]